MLTATSIEGRLLFPLSDLLGAAAVPDDIAELDRDTNSFLNSVYFADSSLQPVENGFLGTVVLVVLEEIVIAPFGDVAGLVIGGGGGVSVFEARVRLQQLPGGFLFRIGLYDVAVGLRLSPSILRPLKPGTNEPEPPDVPLDIQLGAVSIAFGTEESLSVMWTGSPSIPRCMIGDSGVIISAGAIRWLTPQSENLPAGTPPAFLGIFLDDVSVELSNLELESNPSLFLDYAFIGRGGFSGRIDLQNLNLSGSLAGFAFTLQNFGLTLVQNSITASNLVGRIELPLIDHPLDVQIGLNMDGGFTVALSSVQPPGAAFGGGLIKVHKDGLMDLSLESIRFVFDQGVFTVALSGEITPLAAGLDWPTFRIQDLAIDSQGNVRVEGGWLDLPDQYVLAFYGFQLEIAKIGFGSLGDGRRWMGFSGGLKLVEGLTAGASVEGMRLIWDPADPTNVALTLNGVGVEFEVPEVIYFKGAIALNEPSPGVFRFDGNIALSLPSIGLDIEAQLVIGYDSDAGYTFFAIYIGVELPAGIPLGQSGVAIFGMAGLFALNMEPGRLPEEAWYAIQPAPSWYHLPQPPGVANLLKWTNQEGSLALGAGVTLGTVVDNGFTLNGRMLLVLVFPGPIIMLEGRANILKDRASLRDEPMFRALAMLDFREKTFLVGLDATYKVDDSAGLIEIGGGAEAYFNLDSSQPDWHLYLGVAEPRERRVRAEILQRLFEANAYLMIDPSSLRLGAWAGYDKQWDFTPLSVSLQAWIEGDAQLSWQPIHFRGALWLHGNIEASVFGFGFGLGADARLTVDAFEPFHVVAELGVKADLPRPLPDIEQDITLEWGPQPTPPALPVPLKEVAIAHEQVATAWPLPAGALLQPNLDPDGDGAFRGRLPGAVDDCAAPPADLPVVPLDARPELSFARPVADRALVSVNPTPKPDWELLGDASRGEGPARARYALTAISLDRWTGSRWETIARPTESHNEPGGLYGAWHRPELDAPNTKLSIWAKTGFHFERQTGGRWEQWFADGLQGSPCVPIPPDKDICCDFAGMQPGDVPAAPWSCPAYPEMLITWQTPPAPAIIEDAGQPALRFRPGTGARLLLRQDAKEIRLVMGCQDKLKERTCIDLSNRSAASLRNPLLESGVRFEAQDQGGGQLPSARISPVNTTQGRLSALDIGRRMVITLAKPARFVEIALSVQAREVNTKALDADGTPLTETTQAHTQGQVERLVLAAPAYSKPISRIEIIAPQGEVFIHTLCLSESSILPAVAESFNRAGRLLGRYVERDGLITIPGRAVGSVRLSAGAGSFCLAQVCIKTGLDLAQRTRREELTRHIETETARWYADGQVLPPWSTFRLKIVTTVETKTLSDELPEAFSGTRTLTQYAYFRTQGPPGLATLSTPIGATSPMVYNQGKVTATNGSATVDGTDVEWTPVLVGAEFHVDQDATIYRIVSVQEDPPRLTLARPFEGPTTSNVSYSIDRFNSGLDDLAPYVAQTIPATVPAVGEKPPLPRPVYRAYDVGVQFGVNYVDQMYAMAGRDLSLQLFDNSGRPARDEQGRLLIPANRWGRQDELSLSSSEEHWLRLLDAADCVQIDYDRVARNLTLQSSGHVLLPETLYEARLLPLLLHETFAGYPTGATARGTGGRLRGDRTGWIIQDDGASDGPGEWTVMQAGSAQAFYVEQKSNVSRGPAVRNAAYIGGTFLLPENDPRLAADHPDQPGHWTDYRVSANVGSLDDDLVGLAVRFSGNNGYLFTMDRELNRRRLVRLDAGVGTILAETPGGYQTDVDTHIAFEAIGAHLRVFVDGTICLEAQDTQDTTHKSGCVGLYCGQNVKGRFSDVQVDDLRATAPTVYRFKLVTSRFADFRHHIHSFPDSVFVAALPDLNGVKQWVDQSVDGASPASGAPPTGLEEAAAFDALATKAVGATIRQPTAGVDVTRIEYGGQAIGLLMRTGEPLDWRRTSLSVLRAAPQSLRPEPPGDVALIAANFATGNAPAPNDESVTLLLKEDANLTDWRIERRNLPGPGVAAGPDGAPLFIANFIADVSEGALEPRPLWQPAFRNLAEVRIVTPAGIGAPSWAGSGGILSQRTWFMVQDRPPAAPAQRGTHAIGGESFWTDIRFSARLRAGTQSGAAGLLFRYIDEDNYYRCALDWANRQIVLVKRKASQTTVLRTLSRNLVPDRNYHLSINATGNRIAVSLDGAPILDVADAAHGSGQVGFYTYGKPIASFSNVAAASLVRPLGPWELHDSGQLPVPSQWRIGNRLLRQETELAPGPAGDTAFSGSVALVGSADWGDMQITATIGSNTPSVAGLVWRQAANGDGYRLVFDGVQNTRQVTRLLGGHATVLWNAAGGLPVDGSLAVRVEVVGDRLRVWVNEVLQVDLMDDGPKLGKAGACSIRGTGAWWSSFDVTHASPQWEPWYQFGVEDHRVSGRRVKVLAGKSTDPTPNAVSAGEEFRFIGGAAAGFAPRLPAAGVDLRLVAPNGQPGHVRRFLPDAAYTAVASRMLRSADGTGLIILTPERTAPGSRLAAGEYRLHFEFRRDIRSNSQEEAVLSENGDTTTEIAQIDVPWTAIG